jgi:acyl carrier protein
MQLDEARAKLNLVFRDVFDDEAIQIHDGMTAKDVEGWDSLSHIHLIVAAEKAFGIRFTTREATTLKDVGEFVRLIAQKAS